MQLSLLLSVALASVVMSAVNGHASFDHIQAATESMFQNYVQHNKEHLQEDIKEKYHLDMDTAKMGEDELTFYYFNLHDFDRNRLLDGLEFLVSMNHLLDDPDQAKEKQKKREQLPAYNPEDPHSYYEMLNKQKQWNEKFKKDSEFIDTFLSKHDTNKDGFISFPEFMEAKREEERRY